MRPTALLSLSLPLLLLLLLTPAAPAAGGEQPVVTLSDWKLERFRYGQGDKIPKKVEAHITVTNKADRQIRDLRSKLTYLDSTGETVKETTMQFAAFLDPGKGHVFHFVDGFVPAFEAYEMLLEYQIEGKKHNFLYRSPDPTSLPVLWDNEPVKGAARLVILGREVSGDAKGGHKLYLRLRNLGDRDATGTKVIVEFRTENGREIGTWKKGLDDGIVPAGKEKVYRLPIDLKVGAYHSYVVRLDTPTQDEETLLAGGSFTNAEEIELAEFKFTRLAARELSLEAKVRNGTKKQVAGPEVVIRLTDKATPPKVLKEIPFEVPGALAPGEIRPVALRVPDCPPFGGYSYEVSYAERTAPVFAPVTAEVAPGQVGVVQVDLERLPDGTLRFTAKVLSRSPHDVTDVQVIFNLLGGPGGGQVGRCAGGLGRLPAGATSTVIGELTRPPQFASFNFKISYTEPKPAPPPTGGPGAE
jgi:hypothetical protein